MPCLCLPRFKAWCRPALPAPLLVELVANLRRLVDQELRTDPLGLAYALLHAHEHAARVLHGNPLGLEFD